MRQDAQRAARVKKAARAAPKQTAPEKKKRRIRNGTRQTQKQLALRRGDRDKSLVQGAPVKRMIVDALPSDALHLGACVSDGIKAVTEWFLVSEVLSLAGQFAASEGVRHTTEKHIQMALWTMTRQTGSVFGNLVRSMNMPEADFRPGTLTLLNAGKVSLETEHAN